MPPSATSSSSSRPLAGDDDKTAGYSYTAPNEDFNNAQPLNPSFAQEMGTMPTTSTGLSHDPDSPPSWHPRHPAAPAPAASGALPPDGLSGLAHDIATATAQALAHLFPPSTSQHPAKLQNSTMPTSSNMQELRDLAPANSTQSAGTRMGNHPNDVTAQHHMIGKGAFPDQPSIDNPGISMNNLRTLDYVTPDLRQQILQGKHINLAKLLVPSYKEAAPREIVFGDANVAFKAAPDSKLDRPLTLPDFISAFNIYMGVIAEVSQQDGPS